MTTEASNSPETSGESTDESAEHESLRREAEIERLTVLHAERLKDIETDRWRQGERIEALEAQNAELQADFLEQTRALTRELGVVQRALADEQRGRLADLIEAKRAESEAAEHARRDADAELRAREEKNEQLLTQLLASKDSAIAAATQQQRELERQHQEAQQHQAQQRQELLREVAAQREQITDLIAQLLRAKDDALAEQRRLSEAWAVERAAQRDAEQRHQAEIASLERRSAQYLQEQREELNNLRASLARLSMTEQAGVEAHRALAAHCTALEKALGAREQELAASARELDEARLRSEDAERAAHETKTTHERVVRAYEQRIEQLVTRLAEQERATTARTTTPSDESQLQELRQQLRTVERDAARYRSAAVALESKADKAKDTLSFRLGYLLIHAPKSWQGVRSLPRDLLALRKEAKKRRDSKRTGQRALPPEAARLTDAVMRRFHEQGVDAALALVDGIDGREHERAAALTQLAKALKTVQPSVALRVGHRAHEIEPLPFRTKWLAFTAFDCGEIRGPATLLQSLPAEFVLKPSEKARKAEISGLSRLQGSLPVVPPRAHPQYTPVPARVLYVAASALPYHLAGYTIRTQHLVRALLESGVDITVALRPGYPADRGVADAPRTHEIEGVTYATLPGPHWRRTGLDEFVETAAAAIARHAIESRPALIHAASNHVNALPALIAARRLGLPFVYEVRGQWELTAATRNHDWESTERFELERDLETLVARNADQVLVLTEQLARDLAGRGVPMDQLTVAPNAVSPERFEASKKDPELMLRFGLNASSFTIVYAGSVLYYEGLDDLVTAVHGLCAQGVDATLVVAGEGEALPSLSQKARELDIERHIKFVGKLEPADIPSLWSLADAAAFPRKPFRVCELVSPLKPLEPMVMGIPVVVSDVAALREMVTDAQTGLVHRAGDAASLTGRLLELARSPELRQALGRAARERVLRERTWDVVAERVKSTYARVLAQQPIELVTLPLGRSSMTQEEKVHFERLLDESVSKGGPDGARRLATGQAAGRSNRLLAFCLLKAAGACQRAGHGPSSLELARDAMAVDESVGIVRGVARLLYAGGAFEEAVEAVDRLERLLGTLTGKDEEFASEARGRKRLLKEVALPRRHVQLSRTPGKSVYFLHFSLPYTSVGYATRSHGLIAGIRAEGYDVRPYTRPGFPQDFKPELADAELPASDWIDGVEYRRLFEGSRRGSTESEYLLSSADSYERVLKAERPEVVHAASNYVTALPALIAARRLGLPFIYEIRGFWEITRSSRDTEFENSARFALMRHFEGLVAKEADHVFTLTSAMKEELVRRGVDAEKVTLVHNGVDAERFVPIQADRDLANRLGIPAGVPVIGYVGSFVDYEGLDDLVRAAGMLARRGVDFRLLLVGDGAVLEELRRMVSEENLGGRAILTGRVPHDQVEAYYSLVDICPFPRKPWEVCEMVSPLKPFEAMAMKKAVVVSSTHALTEIVRDGETGLVFQKGDANALADALQALVESEELRRRLEVAGRDWVLENRTWRHAGRVVVDGYRAVVAAELSRLARVPA